MGCNERLDDVVGALEGKRFLKLICGASNTDNGQIERLVLVYSLAGVNVIDVAADYDVVCAVKKGIGRAKELFLKEEKFFPYFNEPLLMVSLNAGHDDHFRKVVFDKDKCCSCFKCISVCTSSAFNKIGGVLKFDKNSCFGCGKCCQVCDFKALSMGENAIGTSLSILKDSDIQAVEIHTGKNSVDEIKTFVEEIKNFANESFGVVNNVKLFSFSISSALFNKAELIDYASSLTRLSDKKIIIQIDGESMSATNSTSSSLQALAAANILINSNINAYIQLAGGVNHLTFKYANLFNLEVSGLGYGTFARKILLPYIDGSNDEEFLDYLPKCVNIAMSLVKDTRNSLKNSV